MTAQNNLEIKGNLLRYSPAELLIEALQENLSGSIRLSEEKRKIIIYIESGNVVFAVSNLREHRLFQILLEEKQISKQGLVSIKNFTNDLHLSKTLIDKNIFQKDSLDAFLKYQIEKIIKTVLDWEKGEWIFSPLARVKEEIHIELNLHTLLDEFEKNLDSEQIPARFKSMEEEFCLNKINKENIFEQNNLQPQEAFVITRLGEHKLTIQEIQATCGLPNEEVLKILYKFWLGGIIQRHNWNSPFGEADLSKISSAKYSLKTSAISIEEEEEKRKAEEAKAKEKAEKVKKQAKKTKEQRESLTLEKYLKQVEEAATHYEMFGISPDAELKEIKTSYFSFAKKFHPDLYSKKFEEKLRLRIQNAFTEIANAYDTLKDADNRELYDFRLRKAIEALKEKNVDKTISKSEEKTDEQENKAIISDSFDKGYDLLLDHKINEATPFLARASASEPENPRYHAFYGKALSFDKKQYHRAESELQTAVKLDSQNTTYRLMLAELYIEIGLKIRAKGELKRLLDIDPNHQEAQSMLDSLGKK